MDVFLVPVASDRYQLYCEPPGPVPVPVPDAAGRRRLWTRAVDVFRRTLAEGEAEERRERAGVKPARGWLRRNITMRLARTVAEQRVLWYLRYETAAGLVHPDDISAPRAIDLARAQLGADLAKHRRWFLIDAVLAVGSIPVALLPGPNIVGYYFGFRAVGHWFSMLGARHGLRDVAWQCRPTPRLRLAALVDRAATPLYTRRS